jgi:hypothetical protein
MRHTKISQHHLGKHVRQVRGRTVYTLPTCTDKYPKAPSIGTSIAASKALQASLYYTQPMGGGGAIAEAFKEMQLPPQTKEHERSTHASPSTHTPHMCASHTRSRSHTIMHTLSGFSDTSSTFAARRSRCRIPNECKCRRPAVICCMATMTKPSETPP